eukprot:CAMPEP_0117650492 /NCGR_PEP_ID=MMETSP0804-20121206/1566_1 /TAXON_ID=1074897 /ORGANISM="Tetraselmis astigmatica, Strain CCMP880" /LENGTH=96 /DNA_ID=CAMNT_0005456363 /DNA_START=486 /DNA_END=776 /DNA_ORIENTATION=+
MHDTDVQQKTATVRSTALGLKGQGSGEVRVVIPRAALRGSTAKRNWKAAAEQLCCKPQEQAPGKGQLPPVGQLFSKRRDAPRGDLSASVDGSCLAK